MPNGEVEALLRAGSRILAGEAGNLPQQAVIAYHKPPHLCATRYCRRRHGAKSPKCSRCQLRLWRAKFPMKAKLAILRDRAARKRVPFDLTLAWLTEFLAAGGYDSAEHHIDREKPWLGYVMGNLQILSSSENIAKGNRERHGKMELPF